MNPHFENKISQLRDDDLIFLRLDSEKVLCHTIVQFKNVTLLKFPIKMWQMQHTHRDMYVYIHIYIHLHSYIHTCAYSFIHIYIYLVGGLEHFSIIYGMSSFPLTSIFFKMVKTTNQIWFMVEVNGNDKPTNITGGPFND